LLADDRVIVPHQQDAHVTMNLKPWEAPGNHIKLSGYHVKPTYEASALTWVLEGLTERY
jgi:hypothetical protein